jgi:hypothetical protein
MKEGKKEGKKVIDFTNTSHASFRPLSNCTLLHAPAHELALPQPQLPYPKNSHTTSCFLDRVFLLLLLVFFFSKVLFLCKFAVASLLWGFFIFIFF